MNFPRRELLRYGLALGAAKVLPIPIMRPILGPILEKDPPGAPLFLEVPPSSSGMIHWPPPSKHIEKLANLSPNRYLRIVEGKGIS